MKKTTKLNLGLLALVIATSAQARRQVDTAGAAITTPVSGTLDYTIFGAQDHEDGKRDIAQNIVLPADTVINGAVDIVSFGQAKQLKTETSPSKRSDKYRKDKHCKGKRSDDGAYMDDSCKKSCKSKKSSMTMTDKKRMEHHDKKGSCKRSCKNKSMNDDSMTSMNAESLE